MDKIIIYRDISDHICSQEQAEWAIFHLTVTLRNRNVEAIVHNGIDRIGKEEAGLHIVISGRSSVSSLPGWANVGIEVPEEAESFVIANAASENVPTLFVVGSSGLGLVYAVLELADIAKYVEGPLEVLRNVHSVVEIPKNRVRSITRLFTSEPEDKPWFYDHQFWDEYLTELATHRFNRFTFSVGAGYDYLIDRIVMDKYFCFFYPFVLDVPGYSVEVEGLAANERERNLAMIRYIGQQAKLRGIEFRLGLWNHAYDYGPNDINEKHRIIGLNEENHAKYCRDALALLLKTCPEIEGITFRVHFEGGVPEPTHEFWRVVMERMKDAENLIDMDFHSKGINDELLEITKQTGKQFALSTKYWAEHMGLPYHQASIRQKEFAPRVGSGKVSTPTPSTGHHEAIHARGGMVTTAKRSYTRYGYADFLHDDRSYDLLHRIWPGTQRILLWGDPAMAAGIGEFSGFCGSIGVEWFEPLSFKGKKGSGETNGRELYEDEALKLGVRDWTKFLYTYRLWGRLSYNPQAHPEMWRRFLRSEFGLAAEYIEQALACATRILPFVTVIHAPSVANNVYWPEMYTNIPLVRGNEPMDNPYQKYGWPVNADFDMEKPYNFMNTSSLDPLLIYKINEFADDVLAGRRNGKYSPIEVAGILDGLADNAEAYLNKVYETMEEPSRPSFRRLETDVKIMLGIGRFFAHKFRAGLGYALFEKKKSTSLLMDAIKHYYNARDAWLQVVKASTGVYKSDITFGHTLYSRGHWEDRLEAINEDIAALEKIYEAAASNTSADASGSGRNESMEDILSSFKGGLILDYVHKPVDSYSKGENINIRLSIRNQASSMNVHLYYRLTNQAISYEVANMEQVGDELTAIIPASYTDSPYAIQYFFEFTQADGGAGLIPGFARDLSNQPYFVIQKGIKDND